MVKEFRSDVDVLPVLRQQVELQIGAGPQIPRPPGWGKGDVHL